MRETLGSIRPRDVTLMTSLHFSNARRQRKITIKIALLILSLRCAFQILVFLWARSSHVAHFKEWALVSETCRALCAVRWLDTSKAISYVFSSAFYSFFCSSIVQVPHVSSSPKVLQGLFLLPFTFFGFILSFCSLFFSEFCISYFCFALYSRYWVEICGFNSSQCWNKIWLTRVSWFCEFKSRVVSFLMFFPGWFSFGIFRLSTSRKYQQSLSHLEKRPWFAFDDTWFIKLVSCATLSNLNGNNNIYYADVIPCSHIGDSLDFTRQSY